MEIEFLSPDDLQNITIYHQLIGMSISSMLMLTKVLKTAIWVSISRWLVFYPFWHSLAGTVNTLFQYRLELEGDMYWLLLVMPALLESFLFRLQVKAFSSFWVKPSVGSFSLSKLKAVMCICTLKKKKKAVMSIDIYLILLLLSKHF